MTNDLDKWCIDEGLVRIVLFRVSIGYEIFVGRLIERKLADAKIKKEKFRVFRLFGSYDILLILDDCAISESSLVEIGTIEGITASTEYVCYKWKGCDQDLNKTFAMQELSRPLIGLCFLKINPLLTQKRGILPELSLARFIRTKEQSVHMLGTLGWSEVVLLISDDSLTNILNRIGRKYPRLIFFDKDGARTETKEHFAEKTLTLIGHDLDVSDPKAQPPKIVNIEKSFREKEELEVHFSTICTPQAMASIEAYAHKTFAFNTEPKEATALCLGVHDLSFKVPLSDVNTLNDLIARLDKFRSDNANSILRTHTALQYSAASNIWSSEEKISSRRPLLLKLTNKEAKQLVSLGSIGVSIAKTIYQYNALLANRLLLDAFSDLARVFSSLKREALKLKAPLDVQTRSLLVTRLQFLQQAISQRYQGAYLGVEESPWGAPLGIQSAGIGIHRILKALELYIGELLLRMEKHWAGFVLIGRHRLPTMEHFEDILLVPEDDVLDASRHWAMSHETMHVMQQLEPTKFSIRSYFKENATDVPNESDDIGKLFIESLADLMEFRLSCNLSVQQYLSIVWGYLKEGIFRPTRREQLANYLIRSFVVLYESKFGNKLVSEKRTKALFFGDLIRIVRGFDVDLGELEVADERGQTYLVLAYNCFYENLYHHMPEFSSRIKSISIERMPISSIRQAVAKLQRGQILAPNEMRCPDAIAWHLALKSHPPCASHLTVAWLLSLWNYYQVQLRGPNLEMVSEIKGNNK